MYFEAFPIFGGLARVGHGPALQYPIGAGKKVSILSNVVAKEQLRLVGIQIQHNGRL